MAICTIGEMHAGCTENVIPDVASMSGTLRYVKTPIYKEIEQQIRRIVEYVPRAFGCEGVVRFEKPSLPVMNSREPTEHLQKVLSSLVGVDAITDDMMLASEDFASMGAKVPAAFMLVGHIVPNKELVMNHNPHFDYNEDLIAPCALAWVQLI